LRINGFKDLGTLITNQSNYRFNEDFSSSDGESDDNTPKDKDEKKNEGKIVPQQQLQLSLKK
jgi:hypothetical protein